MDRTVYPSEHVVSASKKCVSVYLSVRGTHGMKKEDGKETCSLVPGMTCLEHEANWTELRAKYFPGGGKPEHVFCDPEGKEIARLSSAPSKLFADRILDAAKKVGPGLGTDEYLFMIDRLAAGAKAVADGKTAEAVKAYGAAAKMSKQPGAKVLADRAQAELDKLNASGKAALDKAMEKVAAKEWAAASASLKEVVEQYKGLPVEKDAGKALADATRQEKAEAKNK